MKIALKLVLIILALTTIYGCGGDSGGATPVTDSYVFPAGKATITFSSMSTATLPAPVSGIDFTLSLPVGMSVTTTSGGASGQIDNATVIPGSALTGTSLAYGSYSSSIRTAHLSMATSSSRYRSGEFLCLTCTVAANTSITMADLKAANSPVKIVKAVGYDATTSSTVLLTDKIKVAIGALR